MPAAGTRKKRIRYLLIVMMALVTLAGISACRGFFGQAPIAVLVVKPTTDHEAPVTITFDISGSTDPDGTIASYDLNFGDGSAHATGTDVATATAITHTYMVAGTYTATLKVTDNDGRVGMTTQPVHIGSVMVTFTRNPTGNYDIYRMRADGTDQMAVVSSTTSDAFFPDLVRGTRDKIAYASNAGGQWNIWKIAVTGGAGTQLTVQTASQQIEPSWSHDGTLIAYASNAAQTPSATTWTIRVMNANNGIEDQAKRIDQTPSWAIAPAYSPVNNDIVFVSDAGNPGGSALWMWNGTTATKLYPATADGKRYGDAGGAAIVTALGLNLPGGAGISKPAWSPDGTKIAFSTNVNGNVDIYVMNPDGTGVQSLQDYVRNLTGDTTLTGITTTKDEFCPYWFEDNSGLAFVREDSPGQYDLYKVSFATGGVTPLTTTGNNLTPAAATR